MIEDSALWDQRKNFIKRRVTLCLRNGTKIFGTIFLPKKQRFSDILSSTDKNFISLVDVKIILPTDDVNIAEFVAVNKQDIQYATDSTISLVSRKEDI